MKVTPVAIMYTSTRYSRKNKASGPGLTPLTNRKIKKIMRFKRKVMVLEIVDAITSVDLGKDIFVTISRLLAKVDIPINVLSEKKFQIITPNIR
jgi:hypothetical protein